MGKWIFLIAFIFIYVYLSCQKEEGGKHKNITSSEKCFRVRKCEKPFLICKQKKSLALLIHGTTDYRLISHGIRKK